MGNCHLSREIPQGKYLRLTRADTTSKHHLQKNVQRANKKYRKNIPATTFGQFKRKTQIIHSMIPHYCFSFVLVWNSLTSHEHASRMMQDSPVWRQKPTAIHEHTHYTTTEQDNHLMGPKIDSTRMTLQRTTTKVYGRHKYLLLVHATSTYVPLYRKLEHGVLLLIGWPLSKSFNWKGSLIFHYECIRMHTATDSHTALL